MRRTIAIFVLLVMVAGTSAPLWASQLSTDAHECCRRTGAHHCSQKRAADDSSVSAAAPTCPFNHSATQATGPTASVLTVPARLHVPVVATFATVRPSSAKAARDYRASLLTRGPPVLS